MAGHRHRKGLDGGQPGVVVSTSSSRPRPTVGALERALRTIDRPLGSAVVAAIASGDRVTTAAVGDADVEAHVPASADTSFALASITKCFVAALALTLADDGEIDLDEPLERTLGARLPVDLNAATLRQALGNRSGIGECIDRSLLVECADEPDRTWSPIEVLARAGPPVFEAGSQFRYTNTNYLLAGLALEARTGASLGGLMHTRLLDRAELRGIVYQPHATPRPPVAIGLADPHGVGRPSPLARSSALPTHAAATASGAAGGMAGHVEPLVRWGHALYGGSILSARSREEMLRFVETGDGDAYGLGTWSFNLKGTFAMGVTGETFGYVSALLHLPHEHATIAVLANAPHDALALAEVVALAR
jgi:D-alanyl-D-alanine carboxypeptidase